MSTASGLARAVLVAAGTLLLLSACAETEFLVHTAKRVSRDDDSPATGAYKVGNPYQIKDTWYYPAANETYDETGIASWYGDQFHGRYTANGEVFDMNSVSAAHRTLPLPSMVRVTNLANGRSLVLRVNDRGPFARGRIIDLSRRAAQLLGYENQGTAKVRVQFLTRESEQAVAALQGGGSGVANASGGTQVATLEPTAVNVEATPAISVTSEGLPPPDGARVASARATAPAQPVRPQPVAAAEPVAAPGVVTTEAVTGSGGMYVQAGAFSMFENANRVRARLVPFATVDVSPVLINGRNLFRVRVGPIASVEQADGVLSQVIDAGFPHAQIVVD